MDSWTWFPSGHHDASRTMSDVLAIADKAPSSVYRGEVYFFDSIEQRDMFNVNFHRPVASDSVLLANHEQHGRRIERSGVR